MADIIQLHRGTSTAWTANNPVLADGEIGFETDTRNEKIGDGVTAWNSLGYQASSTVDATVFNLATNLITTQTVIIQHHAFI